MRAVSKYGNDKITEMNDKIKTHTPSSLSC